ncbi:MAG TPA: hypothetical protein VG166_10570, partial [Caulobacteraceae bacterium]|nr:hypothetical protein [Caulobacteraceae bacterium]
RERASAAEHDAAHAADRGLRAEFLHLAAAWRGLANYSERSQARLASPVREIRQRRKDQAPE